MMRFNLPYEEIRDYVGSIYEAVQALHPAVIYLKNTKIKERIAAVSGELGGWLNAVIDYHTSQGYGKAQNLEGLDGYLTCLEKRQDIELRLLDALMPEKLILVNPFEDWDAAYRKIQNFSHPFA